MFVALSDVTHLGSLYFIYIVIPTLGATMGTWPDTGDADRPVSVLRAAFMWLGWSASFMTGTVNAVVLGLGVAQLAAAATTALELTGTLDEPKLCFNVQFWVAVLSVIMNGRFAARGAARGVQRAVRPARDQLAVHVHAVHRGGAITGNRYIVYGSLLLCGPSQWQSIWFVCDIMRYAGLVSMRNELEDMFKAVV